MSDTSRGFWRITTKLSQKRDQSTALVRDEYLRLIGDERVEFRVWVSNLASAGKYPGRVGIDASAQIVLTVRTGEEKWEKVAVSPRVLVNAIAAWDSGEEYIHNGLEF